jgi:hypothetical protein
MTIRNVHERIGWHNCANLRCRRQLSKDHVTLLTTTHMRRFCSVECIIEGQKAWYDQLKSVPAGDDHEDWIRRVFESIPMSAGEGDDPIAPMSMDLERPASG